MRVSTKIRRRLTGGRSGGVAFPASLEGPRGVASPAITHQLALQHVALGFYAAAGREGERREQRDAFWARFRSWESGGGWAYAVPPP